MNKKERTVQRQKMIREARQQESKGIKRQRIAENLGIAERTLRYYLNGK